MRLLTPSRRLGKGLAAHLEVPLPYLLYRVNARYQEDIKGLKDIQGALSPSNSQPSSKPYEDGPLTDKPAAAGWVSGRMVGSTRLSGSARTSTPLGVRARLNSLSNNSPRPKKASSSSTLTLQGPKKAAHVPLGPTSPSSSEGSDSEDEEARKEDEVDRNAEEQEALNRKLQDLQLMITNDALGLVSATRPRDKEKLVDRGRPGLDASRSSMSGSYRRGTLSSGRSASHSISSASSPQGSIPDIPSPPIDSQPHSPIRRHLSHNKSSSPPIVSPRSALGQRYGPLVDRSVSEQGSNQSSEASSFSDISGNCSLLFLVCSLLIQDYA